MNYWRDILLPSNGLSYDPFVLVKPLEFKFADVISMNFFSANQTEAYLSILREHVRSEVDLRDFYYADVFFLWTMLYGDATQEASMSMNVICEKCNKKHISNIGLADMTINYYDESYPSLIEHHIAGTDFIIRFNRRRAGDNIRTATMLVQAGGDISKISNLELIKCFYGPQFHSIVFHDQEFTGMDKFMKIVEYYGDGLVQKLLNWMRTEDIGIQNDFEFECSECGALNQIVIYDPIQASTYLISDESQVKKDAFRRNYLNAKLAMTGHGNFTDSEIDAIPYSDITMYQEEFIAYRKKKAGSRDYLDESAMAREIGG